MTIITDKATIEVPADVLERLVRGYHRPVGYGDEGHEEAFLDDSCRWSDECRCGLQGDRVDLESHRDHMVREAMQGVFSL